MSKTLNCKILQKKQREISILKSGNSRFVPHSVYLISKTLKKKRVFHAPINS